MSFPQMPEMPAMSFGSSTKDESTKGGKNWLSITAIIIAIVAVGVAAYFFWFKRSSSPQISIGATPTLPTDIPMDVGPMDMTQ